ncbi:MAG TPA: hypothetical protein VIU82_25995 [Bosea sp. (in: a-proteobacteria)]
MAKFKVTGPDGAVYMIDAPDENALNEAVDQMFSGQGAQPAAPQGLADRQDPMRQQPAQEPSFMERTGNRLRFGAQAAAEGLTGIAGFLPDAAAAATNVGILGVNSVAGTKIPYLGAPSELVKENAVRPAFDSIGGSVNPEGLQTNDRMVFEGLSAATGAGAGGLALLRRGVQRAGQIAAEKLAGEKVIPKAFDATAKTYAEAPVATVARDVVGGFGSGTALGATKNLPEEYRGAMGGTGGVIADVLGSLLGGVGAVGAQNLGALALRSGEKTIGTVPFLGKKLNWNSADNTPGLHDENLNPYTKRAVDMAAETYQGQATRADSVAPTLEANRADLQPVLGDRLPSPGALAEDPGIVRLERQVAMQDNAPFIRSEQDFNAGVRDVVDGIAPDGDPIKLQAAAQAEAARLRGETQAANDAALAERQARVDTVEGRQQRVGEIRQGDVDQLPVPQYPDTPDAAKARASTSLDNAIVDQTYIPDRTQKNTLYAEGADPNMPIDTRPMAEAAGRVAQRVEQLPESIRPNAANPALVEDMQGTTQLPYRAAQDTRMQLSEQRNAARESGEFQRADNIGEIQRPLNEALDAANPQASANYRENFAPKYRDGGAVEDLTRKVDRNQRPDPSQTAATVSKTPEDIAGVRRVLDESPARPQGDAAAREYLYADMAEKGLVDTKSGAIRPDRLRNWLAKNSNQLEMAPGMRAEIDNVLARAQKGERVSDGLAQQIKDSRAKLKETERAAGRSEKETEDRINKGALGAVIDADPDKAVAAVMSNSLNSGGRMRELAGLTKNDPEARAGLKAAVRDFIVEKGQTTATEKLPPGDRRGPLSPAATRKLFNEHEKVLAEVFDPDEMNAMRVVQKALDLQKTEQVRVTSGSDTMQKLVQSGFNSFRDSVQGKAAEAVIRLKFGMLKGGGLISTVGRYVNNMTPEDGKRAMELIQRAALEPEIALILATKKIPPGSPRYASTIQKFLATDAGVKASLDGSDDEETPPLEVTVKKRP